MTDYAQVRSALLEEGWYLGQLDEPILDLAHRMGRPIRTSPLRPFVDELRVRSCEESPGNSLSSRFGTGAFPYHCDGAHYGTVPRFVLLRLSQPDFSSRPTLLLDLLGKTSAAQQAYLRSEIWRIESGRRRFLAPVLSLAGLRYDPVVMRPVLGSSCKGQRVIEDLIGTQEPIAVSWRSGLILIVD